MRKLISNLFTLVTVLVAVWFIASCLQIAAISTVNPVYPAWNFFTVLFK